MRTKTSKLSDEDKLRKVRHQNKIRQRKFRLKKTEPDTRENALAKKKQTLMEAENRSLRIVQPVKQEISVIKSELDAINDQVDLVHNKVTALQLGGTELPLSPARSTTRWTSSITR